MKIKVAVVIVAGGKGTRFGANVPKQFIKLEGKEIFVRSVEIFHGSPFISHTVLVMNPDWIDKAKEILSCYELEDVVVVSGGETRQLSVLNGLKALESVKPDIVMIHDAARPLFEKNCIPKIIASVEPEIGVVVTEHAKETLYIVKDGFVEKVPDRSFYWHAKTPQSFFFEEILEAHLHALEQGITNATDDSQLFLRVGKKVKILECGGKNPKITTAQDLAEASCVLKLSKSRAESREPRTGRR